MRSVSWLKNYAEAAKRSDKLSTRHDHALFIAAGLFGEVGSILAEIKKMGREAGAYPAYRLRLLEEAGDFLWYYVRLLSLVAPDYFTQLTEDVGDAFTDRSAISLALDLGVATAAAIESVRRVEGRTGAELLSVWRAFRDLCAVAKVDLSEAATANLQKTQSRWPTRIYATDWPQPIDYHPFFDNGFPIEEQLPRAMTIDVIKQIRGERVEILLRCNEINIGARITDNIMEEDFYRYHDVFHISHAVFLGWSPVLRNLFRCKRKSRSSTDENQDGARAVIVEEAIAALVFGRAKHMRYFLEADQIDYDLLKSISELVRGYEVDTIPTWQWEQGILQGYRAFRFLRDNAEGRIRWDMNARTLIAAALPKSVPEDL